MVFVISASSLFHALNPKPYEPQLVVACRTVFDKNVRARYSKFVYALPGLSCNPQFSVNPKKTVQYVLDHIYPEKTDVVIWHDAINNSLTKFRTNTRPLTPDELIQQLLPYQHRIAAIVYCHRVGAPHIYRSLFKSPFLVLGVVEDLISYRSAANPRLLKEYKELHQPHRLELKSLSIVLNAKLKLSLLVRKRKPKRLSRHRRKFLKARKEQLLEARLP